MWLGSGLALGQWASAPDSAQSKAAGSPSSLGVRAGLAPFLPGGHRPPSLAFCMLVGIPEAKGGTLQGCCPGDGDEDDFSCPL